MLCVSEGKGVGIFKFWKELHGHDGVGNFHNSPFTSN